MNQLFVKAGICPQGGRQRDVKFCQNRIGRLVRSNVDDGNYGQHELLHTGLEADSGLIVSAFVDDPP